MDYVLTGERAGLGPLRRDLVAAYARWVRDPDVAAGIGHLGVVSEHSEQEWFEKHSALSAARVPETVTFTVYDLADDEPVGTAGLFAINHLHGRATYGIALGERPGQGLGTDTTRLVLRYAFDALGLHNVMLTVLAWNERAIAAYRRAGFEDLGVRRAAAWSRGERVDEVLMQAVR